MNCFWNPKSFFWQKWIFYLYPENLFWKIASLVVHFVRIFKTRQVRIQYWSYNINFQFDSFWSFVVTHFVIAAMLTEIFKAASSGRSRIIENLEVSLMKEISFTRYHWPLLFESGTITVFENWSFWQGKFWFYLDVSSFLAKFPKKILIRKILGVISKI